MAKVLLHKAGFVKLLNDPAVSGVMEDVQQAVLANAKTTASLAENGPGGTIDGYADAGFSAVKTGRSIRPEYRVVSNADGRTALAAHFNHQRKFGMGHLREALKKETK